jgi:hypothetical protein
VTGIDHVSDIVDGDGGFGLSHKDYVCFTCQAQIKAISQFLAAKMLSSGILAMFVAT